MTAEAKKTHPILIAALALVAGLLVAVSALMDVHAVGVSKDIYIDENGDFVYETRDQRLTTKIGYETQGYTIHKDENGAQSNTVYATLVFNESNTETSYDGGYVVTKKKIPAATFEAALNKADPTGALLNDYKTGTGILHVNGVMRTFTVDKSGVRHFSGEMKTDANGQYLGYAGAVYGFSADVFGRDEAYLRDNTYAWGNKAAFATHFNKILPYMHGESTDGDEPVEPGTPDIPGTGTEGGSGKEQPEFFTWHTDETYDLGEGIPSGETFKNSFIGNHWYGTYTWEKMPTIEKDYEITFTASGTWTEKYNNGKGETHTRDHSFSFSKTVHVKRKASWYAIRNVDFKELAKVTVKNDSYGVVTYDIGSSMSADCVIDGEVPVSYQDTFSSSADNHVIWPPEPGDQHEDVGDDWDHEPSQEEAFAAAGWDDVQTYADDVLVGLVESWNDKLAVKDGITGAEYEYMSDEAVEAKDTSKVLIPPVDVNGGAQDDIVNGDGGEYGKLQQSKDVTVPINKDNGKYDTTLEVMYEGFTPNDRRTATFTKEKTEAIKEGADDEFGDNKSKEPVVVHTPVVSPVTIKDKDGNKAVDTKTQTYSSDGKKWDDKLKSEDITTYDLLLDENYTIEFDPYKWLSESVRGDMSEGEETNSSVKTEETKSGKTGYDLPGYGESRYEKYIKKREVQFPFPVAVVNSANGSETFYEPEGDYTQWIEIDSNSVQIYIPTWAKESEIKFGHANQNDHYVINFKVTAVNVNEHSGATEDIANSKLNNYVATFEVPVSISGWLYDFTITGTSDSDMFEGYDNSQITGSDIAFSMTKEEKKSGTKNRVGETIWRYLIDGLTHKVSSSDPLSVTANESRNLIPLRDGSSSAYTSMGSLWKGTSFSYLVKSISSLTEDGDKVVITPTLRYYNYDESGNFVDMTDKVKMYYTKSTSSGEQQYVEVGSSRDTLTSPIVQTVQLGSTQFDGARYQGRTFLEDDTDVPKTFTLPDFATYTADKKGVSLSRLLGDKHKSYSVSEISIGSDQRLFTGSVEELRRNSGKSRLDSSLATTYNDGAEYEEQSAFTNSMQTWYGQFAIPDEFYVTTDLRDLDDIAYDGSLSKDSDIWKKGGYLVVNFQINAVHDGNTTLSYQNGSKNMWQEQGQLGQVTLTPTKNGTTHKETINLKDGDVAIYDLSYSSTDKISSHIHNVSQ